MPDPRAAAHPGTMAAVPAAVRRPTARVLPVSPDGAVLLLQDQDPARPGVLRWGSIGGAVEPGESLVEAAVRELHEETGIRVAPDRLVGPVHHGSHAFSYAGVSYLGESTFFALRLERDVEISFDHLDPVEVGNVLAAGWWTADDLEQDGTAVAPELAPAMRAAVAELAAPAPTEGAP